MDDDIDQLIGLTRDLAEDIVALAGELLLSGADIEWVQRQYVVSAIELLADAEAQGVLAAAGDRDALDALGRITDELADLRRRARAEAERSGG